MPIYEYRCDRCGHELEQIQKLSDPALTDCPACAQPALRKLISAAGFRLKGSGWYETDFKKAGRRNLHDSGGAANGSARPAETTGKRAGDGAAAPSASASPPPKPAARPAEQRPAA